MRRLYTSFVLVVLLGLALNLTAQQTPKSKVLSSAQIPSQDQTLPSAQEAQRPTDRQNQQTARSFEGKITKSGGKLVLQELATETNYQLDDQLKAKQYERTRRQGHGDDEPELEHLARGKHLANLEVSERTNPIRIHSRCAAFSRFSSSAPGFGPTTYPSLSIAIKRLLRDSIRVGWANVPSRSAV